MLSFKASSQYPLLKTGTIRLSLLAATMAFLVYCFVTILSPLSSQSPFVSHSGQKMGVADFVIFYGAGVIAASPDHLRIYDPSVQTDWCNRLIAPDHMASPFYIQYPPWFFTLMAPLSVFPIKTAFVIWSVGWFIVHCFLLNLNLKTAAISSKVDRALFISMALASAPAILGMKLGQTSPWYFACLCVLWYGWRVGRDRLGAAAFAVSTIKLQYCPLLALPMLARRRFKMIAWSAIFGAAILLVTVLNVGWHNFLIYPAWLKFVESTGATGVSPDAMINMYGIMLHFLPRETSLFIAGGLFVLGLIYTASVWWRSRNLDDGKRDAWPIAVTLCLALVTGLHVHYHDCITLALAAAFTLKSISIRTNAADPDVWYRIWSLGLLCYPLVSWLCFIYRDQSTVPVIGLINLVLTASAIIQVERAVRGATKGQYVTSQC